MLIKIMREKSVCERMYRVDQTLRVIFDMHKYWLHRMQIICNQYITYNAIFEQLLTETCLMSHNNGGTRWWAGVAILNVFENPRFIVVVSLSFLLCIFCLLYIDDFRRSFERLRLPA